MHCKYLAESTGLSLIFPFLGSPWARLRNPKHVLVVGTLRFPENTSICESGRRSTWLCVPFGGQVGLKEVWGRTVKWFRRSLWDPRPWVAVICSSRACGLRPSQHFAQCTVWDFGVSFSCWTTGSRSCCCPHPEPSSVPDSSAASGSWMHFSFSSCSLSQSVHDNCRSPQEMRFLHLHFLSFVL